MVKATSRVPAPSHPGGERATKSKKIKDKKQVQNRNKSTRTD